MRSLPTGRGARSRTTRARRPVLDLLLQFLGLYLHLRAKQRSRRRLAQLDPRLLRDIGIDPVKAQAEARRGFWE